MGGRGKREGKEEDVEGFGPPKNFGVDPLCTKSIMQKLVDL